MACEARSHLHDVLATSANVTWQRKYKNAGNAKIKTPEKGAQEIAGKRRKTPENAGKRPKMMENAGKCRKRFAANCRKTPENAGKGAQEIAGKCRKTLSEPCGLVFIKGPENISEFLFPEILDTRKGIYATNAAQRWC